MPLGRTSFVNRSYLTFLSKILFLYFCFDRAINYAEIVYATERRCREQTLRFVFKNKPWDNGRWSERTFSSDKHHQAGLNRVKTCLLVLVSLSLSLASDKHENRQMSFDWKPTDEKLITCTKTTLIDETQNAQHCWSPSFYDRLASEEIKNIFRLVQYSKRKKKNLRNNSTRTEIIFYEFHWRSDLCRLTLQLQKVLLSVSIIFSPLCA